MSSQAIKAGDAFVELSLRNMLAKGLSAAEQDLSAFGVGIQNLGNAITNIAQPLFDGLVSAVSEFTEAGSAVNDLSDSLGIGTDALQTLSYAAGQTGAVSEDLATGLKKSQKLLSAAKGGSKQAAKAITDLGLSVETLAGMKPEEQFRAMGLAIGSIEDPADRTAAAMATFGKSGAKLIPMFADSGGLAAMEQRLRDLGAVMTPKQVKWADAFGDALGDLNNAFTGIKNAVAGALVPMLTGATQLFTDILPAVSQWIGENESLTISISAGVVALMGLGTALVVTGAGIVALGAVLSAASVVAGTAGAAVAAIVSPIGLVVVAVAGLSAAVLTLAIDWTKLAKTAGSSIQGIADAIAGQDIALAGQIALAGLLVMAIDVAEGIGKAFADMVRSVSASVMGDAMGIEVAMRAARGEEPEQSFHRKLAQFGLDGLIAAAEQKKQAAISRTSRPTVAAIDAEIGGSTLSSRGTFNPAVIRGLIGGGGGIPERQLAVMERIERNTNGLAEAFEAAQPEFGG